MAGLDRSLGHEPVLDFRAPPAPAPAACLGCRNDVPERRADDPEGPNCFVVGPWAPLVYQPAHERQLPRGSRVKAHVAGYGRGRSDSPGSEGRRSSKSARTRVTLSSATRSIGCISVSRILAASQRSRSGVAAAAIASVSSKYVRASTPGVPPRRGDKWRARGAGGGRFCAECRAPAAGGLANRRSTPNDSNRHSATRPGSYPGARRHNLWDHKHLTV